MTINRYHCSSLLAVLLCAVLCALPWGVWAAAEYYVTPTGAGSISGDCWTNAYSNVQAAATLATNAGDKIYLQSGVYSNAAQIVISNAAGVTIYGGRYGGAAGNANDYSGTNSTLTKAGGVMRIVYATNSSLTLERLAISDGYLTNEDGAGLHLTDCSSMISNCVFGNNTIMNPAIARGGAIYSAGGTLEVVDSVFTSNAIANASSSGQGGAICYAGNSLVVRGCRFEADSVSITIYKNGYGGAICSVGATAVITNCQFTNCYVLYAKGDYSASRYGGAVYLSGGNAQLDHCGFDICAAKSSGGGGIAYGGAIYAASVNPLTIAHCTASNSYASGGDIRGGVLYCSGTTGSVSDCSLDSIGVAPNYAETIRLDGSARMALSNIYLLNNSGQGIYVSSSFLTAWNVEIANSRTQGVYVTGAGSYVALTNCLVAHSWSDGILLAGGTVAVANCTLVDNSGWGLNRTAGTGAVVNSIAWGNNEGGLASNSNLNISYCCSQSASAGNQGNFASDPLFVSLHTPGYYYLSTTGLTGQVSDSPCNDTGSNTAAYWGLNSRTTRTDGTNDTGFVNMGYHYANGVPGSMIVTTAVCYVDAETGDDAQHGQSWATSWQSITHALTNVAQNATINLAAGTYSADLSSESFPLMVQMSGLTVIGTNRDTTIIDARNGSRILSAINKGSLNFSGVSFLNGSLGSGDGAGLYLPGCHVTVSNCAFGNNMISNTTIARGGAIYSAGGTLEVVDSVFTSNAIANASSSGQGGAICYAGNSLVVRGCRFEADSVSITIYKNGYGGAICSVGATAVITNCQFTNCYVLYAKGDYSASRYGGAVYLSGGNAQLDHCGFDLCAAKSSGGGGIAYGGAICAASVNPLTIAHCTASNSYASGGDIRGGVLYCSGTTGSVSDCSLDSIGVAPNYAETIRLDGSARMALSNIYLLNNSGQGIYVSSSFLTAWNVEIANSRTQGVYVTGAGSYVALTNCLVAHSWSDGILLAGGTVAVANCTLVDNSGWGLNRTAGTGAVVNSIAWGNNEGGLASNSNLNISYCCSQSASAGNQGNFASDPLFVSLHTPGYYYLSTTGLTGQVSDSPCNDTGSNTAAYWGLNSRTTRTDGTNDTGFVNMGYHYANGVPGSMIVTTAVCYVDAETGDDAQNGQSWATSWQSITHALTNVAQNATINLAAGTYSADLSSESFPLMVQMSGLTVIGTNRDTTIIDARNGSRILSAINKGSLNFSGVSFLNGSLGSGDGAGLYLPGCHVTVSNCAFGNNMISNTTIARGGAIYSAGGTLEVVDSVFTSNAIANASSSGQGGAICYAGNSLVVRGCRFEADSVSITIYKNGYGGAICSVGATAVITNCQFTNCYVLYAKGDYSASRYGGAVYLSGGNAQLDLCGFDLCAAKSSGGGGIAYGGAICAASVNPLTIAHCTASNSYASGGDIRGGVLYCSGTTGSVSDCSLDSIGVAPNYAETIRLDGSARMALSNIYLLNNSGQGIYVSSSFLTAWNVEIANSRTQGVYVTGAGSYVALTNCLVAHSWSDGILLAGGTVAVVNCTIVTNTGWGITNAGALTVKNSIAWANASGGIRTNATTTISYTDSQEALAGAGNMNANPLFVDIVNSNYHVMSLAGSWRGGGWTNDAQMSPCIDAGEPASGSAYALEPKPNGGRVNMGAYGNTEQASRSSRGTVIAIW